MQNNNLLTPNIRNKYQFNYKAKVKKSTSQEAIALRETKIILLRVIMINTFSMSELTFNSIKSEPQKLQDHSTLIAFQSSIYQIIANSTNYNI